MSDLIPSGFFYPQAYPSISKHILIYGQNRMGWRKEKNLSKGEREGASIQAGTELPRERGENSTYFLCRLKFFSTFANCFRGGEKKKEKNFAKNKNFFQKVLTKYKRKRTMRL